MFDIMRAHQLKMNPKKVLLGCFKWQVPGIHRHIKGIHFDPDKVKDIQSIQPPKNLKELRGL